MSKSEDRRTEIALFRYPLILPFLRGEYPPGGKQALREQIASRHHEIPHSSRSTVSPSTLARWERQYRADGFDGLKPKPRSDRGKSRAISEETLDRAETLKREQPRRSARTIIEILALDQTNPIPEERIAPRTIRRHLTLRDATTPQLLAEQSPKPYRRFERGLASHACISATCGRVMPCTDPISPIPPIPKRSGRSFSLLSSTITLVSCLTLSSTGMNNCRGWKTASNAPSGATAVRCPSTSTWPGSTPPSTSTPSAPRSGSSASSARPTIPRAA